MRAAAVDKDRQPKWKPARLEQIGRADVLRHFAEPEGGDLGVAG